MGKMRNNITNNIFEIMFNNIQIHLNYIFFKYKNKIIYGFIILNFINLIYLNCLLFIDEASCLMSPESAPSPIHNNIEPENQNIPTLAEISKQAKVWRDRQTLQNEPIKPSLLQNVPVQNPIITPVIDNSIYERKTCYEIEQELNQMQEGALNRINNVKVDQAENKIVQEDIKKSEDLYLNKFFGKKFNIGCTIFAGASILIGLFLKYKGINLFSLKTVAQTAKTMATTNTNGYNPEIFQPVIKSISNAIPDAQQNVEVLTKLYVFDKVLRYGNNYISTILTFLKKFKK